MLKLKKKRKVSPQYSPKYFWSIINFDIVDGNITVGELELRIIDVESLAMNLFLEIDTEDSDYLMESDSEMRERLDEECGDLIAAIPQNALIPNYDKIFVIQNYQIFKEFRGNHLGDQGICGIAEYIIAYYLSKNQRVLLTASICPKHFEKNDKNDTKYLKNFYKRNFFYEDMFDEDDRNEPVVYREFLPRERN